MSSRQKGQHKPRHRTHAIKPASVYKPASTPGAPKVETTPPTAPPEQPKKNTQERVRSED